MNSVDLHARVAARLPETMAGGAEVLADQVRAALAIRHTPHEGPALGRELPDGLDDIVQTASADGATEGTVRGVALLSLEAPHIQTVLVGDGTTISALLARVRHDPERISVHHAADAVKMWEKPVDALAEHPQASVAVAAQLVAD